MALAVMLLGQVALPVANASASDDVWPMLMGDAARTGGRGTIIGPGTGALLWSHSTPYSVNSPPAIADGRLFITYGGWDEGGGIGALDAKSGQLIWSHETDSIHGSAVTSKSVVVIGDQKNFKSGSARGFDVSTGEMIWQHRFEKTYVVDTPAISGESIYVSDGRWDKNEGGIQKIRVDTGQLIYSEAGLIARFSIAIVDKTIAFSVAFQDEVYIVDMETNKVTMTIHLPESGVLGPPSISNGVMIIPTEMDGVYGLDLKTGGVLWNYNVPIDLSSTVPVADDMAIIASLHQIHVIDIQSGELLNTFAAPTYYMIATHQGIIYMSANTSPSGYDYDEDLWYIIAMDLETGEEYWRYQLGKYTTSPPIIVDGILYQVHGDQEKVGGVVALDAGYLAAVESGALAGAGDSEDGRNSGIPSPPVLAALLVLAVLAALRRNPGGQE